MNAPWIGTIIAGILAGSFVIPSNKIKRLSRDQTCLIYFFVGLIIMPAIAVFAVSPGLYSASIEDNSAVAFKVMLCGAGLGFLTAAVHRGGRCPVHRSLCHHRRPVGIIRAGFTHTI